MKAANRINNMVDINYYNRSYSVTVSESVDNLELHKSTGSDWCEIRAFINDDLKGSIELRSKEMAEHLHFMLGQMLDVGKK